MMPAWKTSFPQSITTRKAVFPDGQYPAAAWIQINRLYMASADDR